MTISDSEGSWLFVTPWDLYHPGGVNQVVQNLFDELASQKEYAPLLLVKSWDQRKPVESLQDGRRTIHCRLRSIDAGSSVVHGALLWMIEFVLAFRSICSVIRDNDVRVVNVHYPGSDVLTWLVMRLILRRRRLRILLSFHGADLAAIRNRSGNPFFRVAPE
jgi:hypothetical protein